ncbi:MAG: 30S ribosomal protein S12 methylthiotransferase RimO [Lachnospiraceae bacterium]|nr:30S ribosomal protein S12 methylthiotransferase RimO [Lachnospiraceae bacterium]
MKLLMISLGCDKNLTNTEEMMGLLAKEGYSFTDDEEEADIIVVNSCCFIGDAKEESINTILQMAEHKQSNGGRCKVLAVCGCLAQRYSEEIRKEIEEVDVVIGTSAYEDIVNAINNALNLDETNNSTEDIDGIYLKDISYLPDIKTKRLITTGGHYAYLKIAEGCNKHCTYCIIPSLRGSFRSVPMEKLIEEAKSLASDGVKELILVAQETTLYGVDIYGEKKLHELLYELNKVEGISWIRLLYAYPEEITDELIEAIASCEKVCNYIDMPVQSGSDSVLKRMGRLTTVSDIKNIVFKLRNRIPDICIRTTLITGFPGETDENHRETVDFVDEIGFDRLGVFTYSEEEDTPAFGLPDKISEDVKEQRKEEIMYLQQEIVFDDNEDMVGRELLAFIEGQVSGQDAYVARTYKDAPGVDSYVFIDTNRSLMSGDIVKVIITGANEYDLIGVLADELTE